MQIRKSEYNTLVHKLRCTTYMYLEDKKCLLCILRNYKLYAAESSVLCVFIIK